MEEFFRHLIQYVVDGLRTLQIKDWLTLGLSFSAFLISIYGVRQRITETRASYRKQLTDMIEKLHDSNIEMAKAHDPKFEKEYPANFGGMIIDQRRFIVKQTKYLAERVPYLVSPYELMVIAIGLDDIDDLSAAEQMFIRTIQRPMLAPERVIVRRQYARVLFRNERAEDGRKQYLECLKELPEQTDREICYRGDTFHTWAAVEAVFGDPDRVADLLASSERSYSRVRVGPIRERNLTRLAELKQRIARPDGPHSITPTRPNPQPAGASRQFGSSALS